MATTVFEVCSHSLHSSVCVSDVYHALNIPYFTVQKVLPHILHFYPCKSNSVHLLQVGYSQRFCKTITLQFLARKVVYVNRPRDILKSDEAHFCLNRQIYTQNSRKTSRYPGTTLASGRCNSTVLFTTKNMIIGLYFFWRINCKWNWNLFCHRTTVPWYAERFLDPTISAVYLPWICYFMQDRVPIHIDHFVKDLLRQHFTAAQVIRRRFSTVWPVCSLDTTYWDFWFLGFLKDNINH